MGKHIHHRLEPQTYCYTFCPGRPALRVRSGDLVTALTVDALGFDKHGNRLSDQQKQKSKNVAFLELNPLVGPIFVEGAEPGDLLKVTVQKIIINREYAISGIGPHFGSLTAEGIGKELLFNEPLPSINYRWQLDLNSRVATLLLQKSNLREIRIPFHAFIGSIGVAPRFGRVETSIVPEEFGGNMDCPEITEGAIIYFPIWVKGAYLSFGDVHAVQGDGEMCGAGLDTTAEVTLKLEIIKHKAAQWPRIENETHIMVVASARPLMDAIRIAFVELIKWLTGEYEFDKWEAIQIASQVVSIRVGNIVNPNYSVAVKFPKKYLP